LSNPPRCDDEDYIDFLVASQKAFTCTEASRSQPSDDDDAVHQLLPPAAAHDSFTRLLERLPQNSEALWNDAKKIIRITEGCLIVDDTTLDKPYAEKMDYVTYHWSGKHHRVVKGINLITTLWTDGSALIPCDFRLYNAQKDKLTKNDHFHDMLLVAKQRGMEPKYILFDSWYSTMENLKLISRDLSWHFFCRLKENRLVNPTGRKKGNKPVSDISEIPPSVGIVVHLKGYGMIRLFKTVSTKGDVEYWATDDLEMNEEKRKELSNQGWGIEEYHRGVKQCCGIERAQVRKAKSILNHIKMSIRAFVRLELYRLITGVSWYEAKARIVRDAVRNYLAHPIYLLRSTA
jgi:putative transposase